MTPDEPMHLVVIGSSAGGIEALSAVLAGLPKDFPAPIIIAQHMDPERPSHLAEILSRRTPLEVRTISDQLALRRGIIYLPPANADVVVVGDYVALREHTLAGPMPSVDLLFTSAASAFGEQTIGVVLSGTGRDGASGAYAVKQQGGTVVIQNPETATYPSMPESLAPTIVDLVADADRIGHYLNDFVTGKGLPAPPEVDLQLVTLLSAVRSRTAIDFSMYKRATILRRLQRRMTATNCDTLEAYSAYLETHPAEYNRLVSSFLIKVTEFFRDAELFGYLRDKVIPAIVDRARSSDREMRIWSAACSTGEEAYSVAMLLSEALGDDLDQFRVRIFATDLDEDAVAFARRGVYPASSLAGADHDLISRYFIEEAGEYTVRKSLRTLLIFGEHDLSRRPPFPHTDLVLCRNVLIYFTPELQKRALQLFAFSLVDGGYLVLGKAESIAAAPDLFAPDDFQQKVFRRHGPPIPVPLAQTQPHVTISERQRRRTPAAEPGLAESAALESARQVVFERLDAMFLNLPAGLVVIDKGYRVQHVNLEARRLLGIYGIAIGEDFLHLADRMPSRRLRTTIDEAFRDQAVKTLSEGEIVNPGPPPSRHYLDLICGPYVREEGAPSLLSILVIDVTNRVAERQVQKDALAEQLHQQEAAFIKQEEEKTTLAADVQLLSEANRELRDANEKLAAANMQLQMASEQALIGTEEAQAASEEVETLNEELQSSNEELESLNEELQATVEELNTANEELTARSAQMTQMATVRDERTRTAEEAQQTFEATLAAIPAAVLVVDPHQKAILSNERYSASFGSATTEFQAEDADGRPLRRQDTPQARAARGETFEMEFWTVLDGQRRRFQVAGNPLLAQREGGPGGGLLFIREAVSETR